MGINYRVVAADVTYPLVDTVVGTEPIEGVVHLEQVFLEDGRPDVDITLDDDGNAIKQPKYVEVQKMREIREAQPDKTLPPDGVQYEVLAWQDDDEKDAITLKFYIGRGVFENYPPDQRADIVRAEVEIKYTEAKSSWLEGVEIVDSSTTADAK